LRLHRVEVNIQPPSMTAAEFRRIALSLPQAREAAHMGHPDFRVRAGFLRPWTIRAPAGAW